MATQFRNFATKFQLLKAEAGKVTEVIALGWCQHQTHSADVKGGKIVQVGHSPDTTGEFDADGNPLYNIQIARIDPTSGEGLMGSEGITARIFAYSDSGEGLHEPLKVGDALPDWVVPALPASVKSPSAKKAQAAKSRKSRVSPAVLAQLGLEAAAPQPAPTQAEKAEAEAAAVAGLAESLNAAIEAAPAPTKGKGK